MTDHITGLGLQCGDIITIKSIVTVTHPHKLNVKDNSVLRGTVDGTVWDFIYDAMSSVTVAKRLVNPKRGDVFRVREHGIFHALFYDGSTFRFPSGTYLHGLPPVFGKAEFYQRFPDAVLIANALSA
jgi:hypothetical protein